MSHRPEFRPGPAPGYGSGYNPLGRPSAAELATLDAALRAAGRDPALLERTGGTRAVFPAPGAVADLG
jgi:hypothetical protein